MPETINKKATNKTVWWDWRAGGSLTLIVVWNVETPVQVETCHAGDSCCPDCHSRSLSLLAPGLYSQCRVYSVYSVLCVQYATATNRFCRQTTEQHGADTRVPCRPGCLAPVLACHMRNRPHSHITDECARINYVFLIHPRYIGKSDYHNCLFTFYS